MEQHQRPIEVVVWGDYACFTRPEAKAERVTYPVPTPSATRGILEAIFWKPEFRYLIREIHVLKPVRYASILRNEVTDKMPDPRRERPAPMDIATKRTQRHTLALKDVAYRIFADVEVRPEIDADPAKYRDQFRRRIERGRCFHRPGLGCREFAADFGTARAAPFPIAPIPLTQDLGLMLFDIAFPATGDSNFPLFFNAELIDGRMEIPAELYVNLSRIAGPPRPRPLRDADTAQRHNAIEQEEDQE